MTLFSLKKWVGLALKANPNVVGLLWLRPENVVGDSGWCHRIVAIRDAFSSLHAYNSFVGYAHAQMEKMQKGAYRGYMGEKRKALVDQFGYDPKHAAHAIRLLRMGVEFLQTGQMQVWREDREELKRIKAGEWAMSAVQREADRLFSAARDAKEGSALPAQPDYDAVENLLMEIHLESLSGATYGA